MPQQDELVKSTKEKMSHTIESFQKDLNTVRTGRANSAVLDNIKVEYYGFPTPLNEIAQVSTPEPRVIMIKPYEHDSLKLIETAIIKANIGMMPNNDGSVIRLNVPPLTEERRKEYVKLVGKYTENAKIAVRNIRRAVNDLLKNDKAMSEDVTKRLEKEIQKLTDEIVAKVDSLAKAKEKDIMTI